MTSSSPAASSASNCSPASESARNRTGAGSTDAETRSPSAQLPSERARSSAGAIVGCEPATAATPGSGKTSDLAW